MKSVKRRKLNLCPKNRFRYNAMQHKNAAELFRREQGFWDASQAVKIPAKKHKSRSRINRSAAAFFDIDGDDLSDHACPLVHQCKKRKNQPTFATVAQTRRAIKIKDKRITNRGAAAFFRSG